MYEHVIKCFRHNFISALESAQTLSHLKPTILQVNENIWNTTNQQLT